MSGRTRTAASVYLARGYAPVPLAGKRPLPPGWPSFRVTEADIPEHFEPDGDIGILLGEPSGGLVDVDLDCPEARDLADRILPATGAETGRPSAPRSHRWYRAHGVRTKRHTDPINGRVIVELRGDGCQTVVGPSLHQGTGEPIDILEGTPATVDGELLHQAVAELAAAVVRMRHGELPEPKAPPRPVGQPRGDDYAHTLKRAARYLDRMPAAVAGCGGHSATYSAAVAMVHGFELTQHDALDLLMTDFNPRCEPPWPEKDLRHKVEDAATKPHDAPRGYLRDAERPNSTPAPRAKPKPHNDGPPDREPFRLDDIGNGERLAERYRDVIRYVPKMNKWRAWTGTHWAVDEFGQVERHAKATARSLLIEAANCDSDYECKRLIAHATRSASAQSINAMMRLAKSEEGISADPGMFDADPFLFNAGNGTIDLRTGEIREHRKNDHLTNISPVSYDGAVDCPMWLAFLDRIMDGNGALITFLQRAIGYSLTANADERCMFVLYGGGDNGKTTFVDTVCTMLGSGYAMQTPASSLLARRNEESPRNDLARLAGARLVTAVEPNENRALDEGMVKCMTGDVITCRFLDAEHFSYQCTYKVFLATNHRPVIRGTDNAIWNRVRLVPFNISIPKEEQRPRKDIDREFLEEMPGILAWAVDGCLDWQRDGLTMPHEVKAATAEYRSEMDTVSLYVAERCIVDPQESAKASELYKDYKAWCDDTGERAMSQTAFGRRLEDLGYPKRKANTIQRVGICLRDSRDSSLRFQG